ncbi:MAG: hypothetical protein K0R29_2100 [Pseudobdellovibrio sp.]|nr:hypothetical protein [Pseudobdellovibrio sp.]
MSAFAEGGNCAINPDGSHYSRNLKSLRFVGADQKLIWENPVPHTHHQLVHSKVTGDFLAMHSEFKSWNGKATRFDVLLVLNDKGQITKRFSLYSVLKNHSDLLRYATAGETNWYHMLAGVNKNILEMTHANSFIELTEAGADGTPKLTGYLVNCTFQSKFFILDPSLSNVVKVIDLNDRSTHSVTQMADGRLLFYRNSKPKKPLSSAEVYDLKTNQFSTLYKSNNPYLSASACSSVQMITADKLMLSHSQCIPSSNKADYGLAVEFVDLKEQKSFYYLLHKNFPHSGTYLIDGRKFVESRPKL